MTRALWELFKASLDLLVAKIRGLSNPCPPHDWDTRFGFCRKCGRYRENA